LYIAAYSRGKRRIPSPHNKTQHTIFEFIERQKCGDKVIARRGSIILELKRGDFKIQDSEELILITKDPRRNS
jgi:hypothetical protein